MLKILLKQNIFLFFILSVVVFISCNQNKKNKAETNQSKLGLISDSFSFLPSVKERIGKINEVLQKDISILLLPNITVEITELQNKFITIPNLKKFTKDSLGNNCLNEIFTFQKALPSDLKSNPNCTTCYKVNIYNFTFNKTLQVIYDAFSNQIISGKEINESAPDIPEHLKKIAVDIAINSSLVKNELGEIPEIKDAQMAYTKTALNKSKCQRSLHLCVAPTFVKGEKALWSIIDLTDLNLVGIRWTNVGNAGPVQVSERTIQNEVISDCYCEKENVIDKFGWKMKYNITSSDGLRIAEVEFNNNKILTSAKLVDWHVSYSNSDGFGYSDGIGCPTFSLSAVTAWDAPKIMDLKNDNVVEGFVIEQVFKSDGWPAPCNYNYLQRYEFYKNGKFRISTASIGRGCGNDGIYRPVFRIAFEGKNQFSQYDGNSFNNWETEKYTLQQETTNYTSEGYAYQLKGNQNYFIEPSKGQFKDGGRGDYAFVYISKFKEEEGESDLVTIGPCCNIDYKQGPEKFIEPIAENIKDEKLVMWYVPQMHNDNTKGKEYCWAEAKIVKGKYTTISYPCFVGPMFTPSK